MSTIGIFGGLGRNPFLAGIEELSHKWGWYLALGIFLMGLGAVATSLAFLTTLFTVVALGWILLIAGGALCVLSFMTGRWGGFLLSLAAGILCVITGILLLRAPLSGAAVLTLVVAAFFLVEGIYRAIASVVMRFPNWGWSLASGIVSLGLGAILLSLWPAVSLWFLGLYIGIDLIVHGFAWFMFALSVRGLARGLHVEERLRPAA
ncbi:MAG: HdeD family acid-resistance protein [Bryobacteraceae bacterium]